MEAHFVTYLSPGTMVAESTTRPVPSWDVEIAKSMVPEIKERHGATPYGFRFTTRTRSNDGLDSKETASSGVYYLGGTVETLAEIKDRGEPSDRILILNMEGNGWDKVITNTNSWKWTQPLRDGDVVLQWP